LLSKTLTETETRKQHLK